MNKKMKFKKRLFAVFSVVLLLASLALGCVASAWSFTEAPFYNYFDNTKIALKDTLSNNAYVSAVNPEFGSITISMKYNGRKGLWVASYSNSDVTLRDLCPEMVVGETYVLGGNYGTVNLPVGLYNRIVLHDGSDPVVWEFGKSMVITAELLNCRISYYFGNIAEDDTYFQNGQVYSIDLQLWINKGTVLEDFAPHNLGLAGYQLGYQDGYDAAKDEILQDYTYISKDNCIMFVELFNSSASLPNMIEIVDLSAINYVWDGFSFDSSRLPVDFFANILKEYEGYSISRIRFIVTTSNVNLYTDNITLALGGRNSALRADIKTGIKDYVFTYNVNAISSVNFINSVSFGTELKEQITEIAFSFTPTRGNESNFDFSIVFGANNSLSFDLGYQNGKEDGFASGKQEGLIIGEQSAQDKAYQDGYDYGYSRGKNDGYYDGVADEANQGGFFKMIYAVIDAPVQVLMQLFDFDILGYNMLGGFISLVSIALAFVIVSTILKLVI